ncbi:MAG: asparagine synthetase B, partial [Flavobacteriaceae bacterium]|nr:asparagine synthetase B [Flavobacteriaceae bacterium]
MKKIIFIVALSLATLTQAQKFKKLDVSPMDRVFYPMSNRVSDKAIIITYSRPQLKGRKLA